MHKVIFFSLSVCLSLSHSLFVSIFPVDDVLVIAAFSLLFDLHVIQFCDMTEQSMSFLPSV